MNRRLKRYLIDLFAGITFAFIFDILNFHFIIHIPLYTVIIGDVTQAILFRTWTSRVYGIYLNHLRKWFGEGGQ